MQSIQVDFCTLAELTIGHLPARQARVFLCPEKMVNDRKQDRIALGVFVVTMIVLMLVFALDVRAAEVTFTADELAALKGDPGPAGADGTRITELAGICSADIGGQVFEWHCLAGGLEPVEPEVPAEPKPPTTGESVNNGDGTVTLLWTAPTEYTDGTPIGPISRYRVNAREPGQDWTYDGQTTSATIRLTQSGCYTVRAIVEGRPWSDFSNEVCLR